MGLTITQSDGTVSSSTTPSTEEANKQAQAEKFVLGRALHLTADGRVVEEDDVDGVSVLGGPGTVISEADVKKYGLNDSHRLKVLKPEPTPTPVVPEKVEEKPTETKPAEEPKPEEPKPEPKPKAKKS